MYKRQLGNFNLVLNLIPSVKVTFDNNDQMNQVVETILLILRRGSRAMNFGINDLMETSILKLEEYQKSEYDRVAFLYFDFLSWIRSIRNNSSVEEWKKG